jgi:hypothetical protein
MIFHFIDDAPNVVVRIAEGFKSQPFQGDVKIAFGFVVLT